MRLAQPPDPLLQRLQLIAQFSRVAYFSPPTRRTLPAVAGHRRGDTVLVDIQPKIEFFFHWCVCWFSVVKHCNAPEPSSPGRCCGSAPPQKGGVARE